MKDDELRDIFFTEAQEQYDEINRLFVELEQNKEDKQIIDSLFRLLHTLKANAGGMGFEQLAQFAHTLEDVFGEIKKGNLHINSELFNTLFRANDVLGAMIQHLKDPERQEAPKYRGIKTKLEVLVRKTQAQANDSNDETEAVSASPQANAREAAPPPSSEVYSKEEQRSPLQIEAAETAVATEEQLHLSDSIHVPVKKLDNLLNLVGELIIEKDRILNLYERLTAQRNGYNTEMTHIQRLTNELQHAVMSIRLVQVGTLFKKFHRIVRDVANEEGKHVRLVLKGMENEIDRNILQIISESLVHLVRNAISHGIETEDERVKQRKPGQGTVTLSAETIKEEVRIQVSDDGRGIDIEKIKLKALQKGLISPEEAKRMPPEQLMQLIFLPGFSSADTVTKISGRGVGMDVVKRAIERVGGQIDISSTLGKGTTFTLILPLSMAVKSTLLFQLNDVTYAIPLAYTSAVSTFRKNDIHYVRNGLATNFLGKSISVVFLKDIFSLQSIQNPDKQFIIKSFEATPPDALFSTIIINYDQKEIGLIVDKLLQQKEIVEKPLGTLLKDAHFISGATILGTGEVCLVLDVPSLMHFLFKQIRSYQPSNS
jgi:two-component system chemotaxis sensor kinase CheA